MDRDIYVLGFRSRNLCPDNQILVLLDHVDRRGPPGVLCPLLVTCSPGDATEHLVEQAVHLAQRVVEPAAPISAHHILYPFSRVRPASRGGTHIDPVFTFFARLCSTSFRTRSLRAPAIDVIRHAGASASQARYAAGRPVPAAARRRRARR